MKNNICKFGIDEQMQIPLQLKLRHENQVSGETVLSKAEITGVLPSPNPHSPEPGHHPEAHPTRPIPKLGISPAQDSSRCELIQATKEPLLPTHLWLSSIIHNPSHENSNIVLALFLKHAIDSRQELQIPNPQSRFLKEFAFCADLEGLAEFEMASW